MQALDDVTVLDFTQIIAGPACTQWLATFGGEVIKVEPPGGDRGRDARNGSYLSCFNLGGKESIGVDLKTEEGREIVRDLASSADVIVENFRPGVMEKFGLAYDDVVEFNDDVIYCSISGFGQQGPYRKYPSVDPIAQAYSGLMDITGYPEAPPTRLGTSAIDISTGMAAALLVCAALRQRDLTGGGEYIDVSLFDTAVSWMSFWVSEYASTGETPTRSGDKLEGSGAPYGLFSTGPDEFIYILAPGDERFGRLCEAIDRTDIEEDPRFTSEADRAENSDELQRVLEAEFESYDRTELVGLLSENGVTVGPVQDVAEVVDDDPQVEALNLLANTYNYRRDCQTKAVKPAYRTTDGAPDLDGRPPGFGEHSREILNRFGLDEAGIDELIREGVIYENEPEV